MFQHTAWKHAVACEHSESRPLTSRPCSLRCATYESSGQPRLRLYSIHQETFSITTLWRADPAPTAMTMMVVAHWGISPPHPRVTEERLAGPELAEHVGTFRHASVPITKPLTRSIPKSIATCPGKATSRTPHRNGAPSEDLRVAQRLSRVGFSIGSRMTREEHW